MKLFWLTAEMPFPPNTGGRMAMFKKIEYFSKNHEIFLFSIVDSIDDLKFKNEMKTYCKEALFYNRNSNKLFKLFKLIVGPYVCTSRWIRAMKKDIDLQFQKINPDYIIVEFPQMLGNLSSEVLKSGKIILNQHNTEYLTLRNISNLYTNPLKKMVGIIDSYRLQQFEKKMYQKKLIKLFTFVSNDDKFFFEKKYGLFNTYHLPIGTEISRKHNTTHNNSFNISYIGKMNYLPNSEAAIWFAQNVFNKLKDIIPNLKYYIVGKNPPDNILHLATMDNNIIVTGTVDSVECYYELSDVVVIPLFHGGGVKVKLLEALGHGSLVITTDKGIEGTEFKHNNELLVANTATEFVNLCITIFQKPDLYLNIKEQALECIEKKYTWASILKDFESKLIASK